MEQGKIYHELERHWCDHVLWSCVLLIRDSDITEALMVRGPIKWRFETCFIGHAWSKRRAKPLKHPEYHEARTVERLEVDFGAAYH